MSLPKSQKPLSWSKTDLNLIYKYKQRINDIEKTNLQKNILTKDVNSIDFYNITPKQKLPKFLQKMKFQTLHSKQNAGRDVKVFEKERESADEMSVRGKLKTQGNIMFLSEIYQSLGESLSPKTNAQWALSSKSTQLFGGDLQQWQKSRHAAVYQKLLFLKRRTNLHKKQSRIIEQKLSQLHRRNTTGRVVNYFKQGSNYKKQIQKQLDIIYNKHSSEVNQVNMYVLIENSARLLKKELDERGGQVEGEMKAKLRVLNQMRIEHHNLYEERTKLGIQERQYSQQLLMRQHQQQQYGLPSATAPTSSSSSSYFTTPTAAKLSQLKALKRAQIDQIQAKIMKNKGIIQQLQLGIQHCEEELMAIMVGEVAYYKMSLRIGLDCRDTGLGWILKRLRELVQRRGCSRDGRGKQSKDIGKDSNLASLANHPQFAQKQQQYEFPLYLDKKSKQFLILKTNLQNQLQHLMQQKRKFVIEIGSGQSIMTNTQSPPSRLGLKNSISMSGLQTANTTDMRDKVVEDEGRNEGGTKKYRMSLRKMTTINLQQTQNQSLLQLQQNKLSPSSKRLQLSTNTDGLTGKCLYRTITQKLRFFDFAKAKKDKSLQLKNSKLMQYQNLLKAIKDIRNKLQDLDSQHENHLISHYKESKEVFFEQCAACFGHKKSYSMVIKYFSWKNASEDNAATV